MKRVIERKADKERQKERKKTKRIREPLALLLEKVDHCETEGQPLVSLPYFFPGSMISGKIRRGLVLMIM